MRSKLMVDQSVYQGFFSTKQLIASIQCVIFSKKSIVFFTI